jgi:hypothetical protein
VLLATGGERGGAVMVMIFFNHQCVIYVQNCAVPSNIFIAIDFDIFKNPFLLLSAPLLFAHVFLHCLREHNAVIAWLPMNHEGQ